MAPEAASSARRQRGFSLVEAIVGLAVLGLALTLSLAVLFHLPRQLERLAAREEANRAVEAVLESVRSGEVTLVPASRPWPLPGGGAAAEDLTLWLDVVDAGMPGLLHVAVTATYRADGAEREARMETLVWRP